MTMSSTAIGFSEEEGEDVELKSIIARHLALCQLCAYIERTLFVRALYLSVHDSRIFDWRMTSLLSRLNLLGKYPS